MIFLGILLIIAGIICLFNIPLIGLIILTLGCICIASSSKKKKTAKKEENEKASKENKEDWILAKTKEYIDQGMTPSDAKVKAEVDYSVLRKETCKL